MMAHLQRIKQGALICEVNDVREEHCGAFERLWCHNAAHLERFGHRAEV